MGSSPWEQLCRLKSSACLALTLQTSQATCGHVLSPRLLLLLGCILPQCELIKSAQLFPSLFGRCVSPSAGPAFPAAAHLCSKQHCLCLAAHGTEPSSSQPNTSKLHTHPGQSLLLCFGIEFQPGGRSGASENKVHLPFLSHSHSYLMFPLWFSSSSYPGITSSWCRTWIHLSTKTISMTSM